MNLREILEKATNKESFLSIENYADFSESYLEFIKSNLQAVIVSRNENNYRFFQYQADGTYNVTRPINSDLIIPLDEFNNARDSFFYVLKNIHDKNIGTKENRKLVNNFIYTCQQSIGAALDALPANRSNTARKINGDLFERFILLIINRIGLSVTGGSIAIPVIINGEVVCYMSYQHDLIIKVDEVTKAIGSIKTSSKDRLDKIFIDKFLFNRLTNSDTPHFAIFLNDVQRQGKEGNYGINTTFLPGHFRVYTIKLNPLDGVYYIDIRPNMRVEDFLKNHIKKFDHFLFTDLWKFTK